MGIERRDTKDDIEYLARKLVNLKLWSNESGKPWRKSAKDNGYGVLLVSQFTLHAVLKGNKPDFHMSMVPDQASTCFDEFVKRVEMEYGKKEAVETGIFGAKMEVDLVNDGPVTLILDSQEIGIKRRVSKKTEKNIESKSASVNNNSQQEKKKKKKKKKIQLSEEDAMRKSKLILQVNELRNTVRDLRKQKGKEEGIEDKIALYTQEIDGITKEIRAIISTASAKSQSSSASPLPRTTTTEAAVSSEEK